jgi:uncharacterized protein with NAD-binding domain and iron-sulfur cluster
MAAGARKKVAILGGGVGSLTAAWYLTERPGWQDEYEITVYQLGWRLGGKGATGRDRDHNERILEHGLHVWFGWYENAWRTLRAVYAELDRAPGQSLPTPEDAFTPRNHIQMLEKVGDEWLPWNLDMPIRPGIPGEAKIDPFAWDVLVSIVEYVIQEVEILLGSHPETAHPAPEGLGGWVLEELGKVVETVSDTMRHSSLQAAYHWMKALAPGAEAARKTGAHDHHHSMIAKLLRHFRDLLNERIDDATRSDTTLRRIWIIAELALTSIIGFLVDGVWVKGLAAIDDRECRDWLRHHGASAQAVDSTFVRALYDCFFGFRDGDIDQHYIAAGAGLGCVMRIGLTYSGSVLYQMNAGMGEVMVAPMYLVLAKRGVEFEFFQKVKRILPSADGTSVDRIEIGVQATLEGGKPYQPLYTVNDLPVWPDRPFYEQLEQGEELRRRQVNLESHWADWEDVQQRTLRKGVDFDTVIQGISLGGLGEICKPLADVKAAWREMLDKIPSTQTFGVQLWFDKTLEEMGWQGPARPAVAAPEPMDVWTDMSQTLDRESYDYRHMPRSTLYLCGPLIGDMLRDRPSDDHRAPGDAWEQVFALAAKWLEKYPGWIWHKSVGPDGGKGLDWNLLFVDGDVKGIDRLKQQFLRANIDPTERYVLSPPIWNKLRMHPAGSGFDNLILAGDWTWNVINAGCVEAGTISGMLASRALTGHPAKIAGEDFLVG